MVEDLLARALSRISVAAPYFALSDMARLPDGGVRATVPHAPAVAPEVGEMEAAQVARHLAILGSCAAALERDDDDRHHYLATLATYTRLSTEPLAVGEPIEAEAVATWRDRRTAFASVTLQTVSGRALHRLECEYTVLKPRMFQRFNAPVPPEVAARGAGSSLSFDLRADGDGVEVACGSIPAALCAGHFPDHPAAPVAILMGQLCKAAGIGMVTHLGRDGHRYRIESGHVEATGLAQAGQDLTLRAAYDGADGAHHRMKGVAEADGVTVGRVSVTMSVHAPAAAIDLADERHGAVAS